MSKYKLVPVEPTPEMEQAAEKYWNDRKFKALSDDPRTWKGLYETMLAVAPAVQGEPVSAQVRYRRLEKGQPGWSVWQPAAVMLDRPSWEIDSQGWEVEYRLLYTAPQPAEQKSAPDVTQLDGLRKDAVRMQDLLCRARAFVDQWDDDSQEFMDLCGDIDNAISQQTTEVKS